MKTLKTVGWWTHKVFVSSGAILLIWIAATALLNGRPAPWWTWWFVIGLSLAALGETISAMLERAADALERRVDNLDRLAALERRVDRIEVRR